MYFGVSHITMIYAIFLMYSCDIVMVYLYWFLFIFFVLICPVSVLSCLFFFNDTATTEIYTRSLVGSVRCV